MKLCIITSLFCFLAILCFGQNVDVDSLSLTQSRHKIDSIQTSFYQRTDSLKSSYDEKLSTIDSSRHVWQHKLDSLTSLSFSTKGITGGSIDSTQRRWKGKLDSLTALTNSSTVVTQKLDSINRLRDKTLAELNHKLESLKEKTIGKLNDLKLPSQLSSKMPGVTSSVTDFKIPATDLNVSSPGFNNSLPGLDNLNFQTPATGLNVPAVNELKNANGNMGALPDVTGKAGAYSNDIQAVTTGNLEEMKALPTTAEAKAEELSGMDEVKDQTKVFDEYKDKADAMQNPDSMKAVAMQEVKQLAVNHFAGKEQQLKEAMETLAKYKSKYSSLNSIADAAKRPPNEMKGKPFFERLVPGIGMQIQKKAGDVLVDFNPYAGYRFTGRITAGVGWNQRVAYNFDNGMFNAQARIFGPRLFGEFKLWKGFCPRVELEVMNTNVPPITRTPTVDPFKREWVWGGFVGVKKEYKFIKNIKGTALVMMRVFNPDHKSPYADVVNVRFGFEFPRTVKR